jgi:putative FmdB family regulatory protein
MSESVLTFKRFLPILAARNVFSHESPIHHTTNCEEETMPTYEYHCSDCMKTFTVHLTMEEHERNILPPCEHCGSKNVKPLLGSATVITSKKS